MSQDMSGPAGQAAAPPNLTAFKAKRWKPNVLLEFPLLQSEWKTHWKRKKKKPHCQNRLLPNGAILETSTNQTSFTTESDDLTIKQNTTTTNKPLQLYDQSHAKDTQRI